MMDEIVVYDVVSEALGKGRHESVLEAALRVLRSPHPAWAVACAVLQESKGDPWAPFRRAAALVRKKRK